MKAPYECEYEDCTSPKEGRLPYCATHNAGLRKLSRELSKPVSERKAVKKFSEKRMEQNGIYAKESKIFLIGKRCVCCGDPATQVHHAKGRTNDLLMEKKYWRPVCGGCHILITEDSAWAIREGYSLPRNH